MKKTFFSFLLSIILLCNFSISALASSDYAEQPMTGMQRMTLHGVMDILHIFQDLGVLFDPDSWASGSVYDCFIDWLSESVLIDSSETLEDYINAHVTVSQNENGEDIANYDSEMVNNIYNFSQELIKENAAWYEGILISYKSFPVEAFCSKTQYDAFIDFLDNNMQSNQVLQIRFGANASACFNTEDFGEVGSSNAVYFVLIEYDDFVGGMYEQTYPRAYIYKDWINQSWSNYDGVSQKAYACLSDGTIIEAINQTSGSSLIYGSNNPFLYYNGFYKTTSVKYGALFGKIGAVVRLYKSVDDMKQYSVGQRPYYTTSDYYNYDSTVDNSTTITQTDIDNSTDYNTIYNYIINNNENPDSLTESELIAILDKYFDDLELDSDNDNSDNNDSGSSGSGSGDSSGSGGSGLSGFLDGLGSIGDAILAILGKLMEYIGKAIELLTGTVTKVIDIIPTNIVALFSAMFPFFPEEWLVTIELLLVLTLVGAIWGIFKK